MDPLRIGSRPESRYLDLITDQQNPDLRRPYHRHLLLPFISIITTALNLPEQDQLLLLTVGPFDEKLPFGQQAYIVLAVEGP
jgi:hypothetical protein